MATTTTLDDARRSVLETIAAGSSPDGDPWATPAQLEAAGCGPADVAAALADGAIVEWRVGLTRYLTLASGAAEAIGWRIDERWRWLPAKEKWRDANGKLRRSVVRRPSEEPFWSRTAPEPILDDRNIRLPRDGPYLPVGDWVLDHFPAKAASPVEEAIAHEEAAMEMQSIGLTDAKAEMVAVAVDDDGAPLKIWGRTVALGLRRSG